MSWMSLGNVVRTASAAGLLTLAMLVGCRSAEQKALDQARMQAAATHAAQQVQYIDSNGDTVTTVVQPPLAGRAPRMQTSITPPPPGAPRHRTRPVVSAFGAPAIAAAVAPASLAPPGDPVPPAQVSRPTASQLASKPASREVCEAATCPHGPAADD